jgi:hypothetical protein
MKTHGVQTPMKPYSCPYCHTTIGYINRAGDLHNTAGQKIATSDKKTTIACPHCHTTYTWGKRPQPKIIYIPDPQPEPYHHPKKRGTTRLTIEEVRAIRSYYYQQQTLTGTAPRGTIKWLAQTFNIAESSVRDIIHYKTWRENWGEKAQ